MKSLGSFVYRQSAWPVLFRLGMFMVLVLVSCTKAPQVVETIPPRPEPASVPPPAAEPSLQEKWYRLIEDYRFAAVNEKLTAVNLFFNELDEADDLFLWGRDDYWATLPETLARSGGDCEDLSIAKYFTLKELNIPGDNMRLTYVIHIETRQPHMVLTLQVDPQEEPIVLDSLHNFLFPVSRRPDLVPVYSFNEKGYWLAKKEEGWQGQRLGSPSRLSSWKGVLTRLETGSS